MPNLSKRRAAMLIAAGLAAAPLVPSLVATLAATARAEPAPRKIGIIGAGHVGSTLGTLWAKAGDKVMFASRHPDELKALAAAAGPNASVGTPAEAIAFGDVVVIAVPYTAMPEVTRANAAALKGKIVFDAGNAIPARDGAFTDEVRKVGIGAYSAKLMPDSHVVRGFNAIHFTDMATEGFRKGERVGIPLAGDDAEAIAAGKALIEQIGFEPVVVPLSRADEIGPGRPLGSGVFTATEWKQKLAAAK